MTSIEDSNNPGLKSGDHICGYQIKRITGLPEIHSVFYELEHLATGARHIHISSKDRENTFGVAFKTVPVDSTGVAHILEHTVLCGSKKFPVRDPFFSMLKRSLSTFMNAFTASDWTMYPFSTQNVNDYDNLMDVYLDAAFHPRLEDLSFKQEGHRMEIDATPTDSVADSTNLVYKGVVYNEMKGAMSSPDQVMVRSILKSLFPDTTYRFNSGGDPVEIPDLSHAQLIEFHKKHYHPSNAYFYTYGDQPLKKHLQVIDRKILRAYDRIDPGTDVPSQPRWLKPGSAIYSYPLENGVEPQKKYQVCLAWLTADIRDAFEILSLSLLEQILLGNSGSPLRKALIDSGLGSSLCDGAGFDADYRDSLFVCGLKDVKQDAAPEIESIVMGVLSDLADNGIDETLAETAIHQIEFHRKEITNTPYPYGMKLLLTFAGSWLHGGDPVKILKFDSDLKKLQVELAKGLFFENQIRKYFLENPHRVLLTLRPDQQMEQKETQRLSAELKHKGEQLNSQVVDKLKADADALQQLQDAEEDISLLPTLQREDIPASITIIKATTIDDSVAAAYYNQETSGISYLASAAGMDSLPRNLVPLVPFFGYAFTKTGTSRRDYSKMAQRIDAYTGGIGLSSHARTLFDGTGMCFPFVSLNGKSLLRNQGKMFDIVSELMFHYNFTDTQRLKNLLLEFRAGLESMVIHNGHRLAISLASRNFSPARALSEIWSGVHQLKAIKELSDKMTDDSLATLASDLTLVAQNLFGKHNFKMAVIGEPEGVTDAKSLTRDIHANLPDAGENGFISPIVDVGDEIIREGWITSSSVSFVADTFETVRMEHEDSPALTVISKMLRSMYLHREIREKGGAYGGFALYSPEDGLFCFASYRDPHLVATLKAYENARDFICSGNYSDEDLTEAILQVCSEIDKPDPPGPAARKAFYRELIALSDDMRSDFKSRLLSLTLPKVKETAQKYFSRIPEKRSIAVISGEEKLNEANEKMSGAPLELHRI